MSTNIAIDLEEPAGYNPKAGTEAEKRKAAKIPKVGLWPILNIAAYGFALITNALIPNVLKVEPLAYQVALIAFIVFFGVRYILSLNNDGLRAKVFYKAKFFFAVGIFLLVWDFLSTKAGVLPMPFFPGPAQIAQATVADAGLLLESTFYSLRLFSLGFVGGVALGIATGVLMGWYRQWEYWLFPIVKVVGIIPAVAWIPIAMAIFPSSLGAGTFLLVISVWFPVAFMTSNGIVNINKSYFEAARTLGAKEWFLVYRIAIPGAAPHIFTGISTGSALAFVTLVVSEMVGAKAGLGWYINWAKGWSIYSKVYAAIIIMAVAFTIILGIIGLVKSRVLKWQKGLVK